MATYPAPRIPPSGDAPDMDKLRSFLVALDATFHSRINILLVAESLFVAALSQVWGSGGLAINVCFCALGYVITQILWDPIRVLAERTKGVAGKLMADEIYGIYIAASTEKLEQTYRLANWVPRTFLIAWPLFASLAFLRALNWLGEGPFKW
jgi:hypothetical protein